MADKRLHHFQKEGANDTSTKRGGLSVEDPDIHKACDMCSISSSCSVVIVSCHVHVDVPSRLENSVQTWRYERFLIIMTSQMRK